MSTINIVRNRTICWSRPWAATAPPVALRGALQRRQYQFVGAALGLRRRHPSRSEERSNDVSTSLLEPPLGCDCDTTASVPVCWSCPWAATAPPVALRGALQRRQYQFVGAALGLRLRHNGFSASLLELPLGCDCDTRRAPRSAATTSVPEGEKHLHNVGIELI
jgi:hypothetical protein